MLETTRTAAAAIFRADPTMTADEIRARLAGDLVPGANKPVDRLVKPRAAARMLSCDRHTLARWGKRGLVRAVRTGGAANRVTGYTESSIRAFLSGKAQGDGVPGGEG